MKLAVFILFLYLVEPPQVRAKQDNTASSKCPAPKQIYRIDDDFAVQLSQPNVVYIYSAKYNSFLVLNTELTLLVILDGSNKTIFHSDTNTGIGGMLNPKLDLVYAVVENRIYFDTAKVHNGDFSIASSLIDYASIYTNKVIGSGIKTNNPAYVKISVLLQDVITTTNYKKWVSYKDGHYVNTALYDYNMNMTSTVHNVLIQYNDTYTAEWGGMIFFVVASEHYKIKEECIFAFIDVMVKLVRQRDFGFSPKLMDKLYDVVSGQKEMTKKEAIEKYNDILKM